MRRKRILITIAMALMLAGVTSAGYAERSSSGGTAALETLFLQGNYDEAFSRANQLTQRGSIVPDETWYLRGLSALKLKRWGDARESFSQIVNHYPRSERLFDARIGIGDSYFLEGNLGQAAREYDDTAAAMPRHKNIAIAYYRIAITANQLGLKEKAGHYADLLKNTAPAGFEARMVNNAMQQQGTPALRSALVPIKSAPAAVAPVQSAASHGGFTVQVGSFKKQRNAQNLARMLSRSGYECHIESSLAGSGGIYRLKVGRYRTRDEAERAAAKLKRAGYPTTICSDSVCE